MSRPRIGPARPPRGIIPTPTGIVPTLIGILPMPTEIDPGFTGIVLIPRGIDAPPGQDGPARSRVDLARSQADPIWTGVDATLYRHRCHSGSGRPDQMRSRPDSDRDRCRLGSGRCRSD